MRPPKILESTANHVRWKPRLVGGHMSTAYTAFAFLIHAHTHASRIRGSKSTRTHLTRAFWNASARLLKNIDCYGYRTKKTRLRLLSYPLRTSHLIWKALSLGRRQASKTLPNASKLARR